VYADADVAGDTDIRKSTTGVVIMWGEHRITWFSKLEQIVTTSTTEAEFVAAATGTKEGLWVRKLLQEIFIGFIPVNLYCDKEAAIALIKNTTAGVSGRTKHIDVQFMFIRDRRSRGEVHVHLVPSNLQLAEVFTKPLARTAFEHARELIGLQKMCSMYFRHLLGVGGLFWWRARRIGFEIYVTWCSRSTGCSESGFAYVIVCHLGLPNDVCELTHFEWS
jgi:hypothetical protein